MKKPIYPRRKYKFTEQEMRQRGKLLAEALGVKTLPKINPGDEVRYDLNEKWGNKTALGLFLIAQRLFQDREIGNLFLNNDDFQNFAAQEKKKYKFIKSSVSPFVKKTYRNK